MSVATEFRQGAESATDDTVWKTVHRVVFPVDGETDTLPLYVDFDAARRVVDGQESTSKRGGATPIATERSQVRSDFILGRRRLLLPAYCRVSFGTYFNAFPASYWRAHTDVQKVRLSIEVDAEEPSLCTSPAPAEVPTATNLTSPCRLGVGRPVTRIDPPVIAAAAKK